MWLLTIQPCAKLVGKVISCLRLPSAGRFIVMPAHDYPQRLIYDGYFTLATAFLSQWTCYSSGIWMLSGMKLTMMNL